MVAVAENLPLPVPRKIEMVETSELATARSVIPSPSKSPVVIAKAAFCAGREDGGPKSGAAAKAQAANGRPRNKRAGLVSMAVSAVYRAGSEARVMAMPPCGGRLYGAG